jgi:hypothetical protein
MSTQDVNSAVELPLTHIERMDELAAKLAHEQRLAQIKASAEVEKAKIALKQQRLNRWSNWDEDVRTCVGILLAVAAVFGIIFGIWWMWANSPGKTPEEMKQDRQDSCVYYNSDKDKPHYTWWPEEAKGEGLCLPEGQKPPSQQSQGTS